MESGMRSSGRHGWRALLWIGAAALLAASAPPCHANWEVLADGLELGRFEANPTGEDVSIVVLRIDPEHWDLRMICLSETAMEYGQSARAWCEQYGLAAAINAGMFATDHSTHVGYLRNGDHVNSRGINHYQSIAAFSPLGPDLPRFRMYDLDVEGVSLKGLAGQYSTVVQNLRLVKRPRMNRWGVQEKRWSEAALGEDEEGRVLFIFCRSPLSMHDLNGALLSLPIGLVCAQHLEGGPEAQLFVDLAGEDLELVGSYETGFVENDLNNRAWPIPNVIGVVPRVK